MPPMIMLTKQQIVVNCAHQAEKTIQIILVIRSNLITVLRKMERMEIWHVIFNLLQSILCTLMLTTVCGSVMLKSVHQLPNGSFGMLRRVIEHAGGWESTKKRKSWSRR